MKIKHLIWLILLIPFLNSCNGDNVSAKNKQPNLGTPDSKLLVLSGNYLEMGTEYGEILHGKLTDSLRILKDFYITQHGATWNQMVLEADKLYARYPSEYKQFLYGMVVGSHLTLDEIKVLNGMETVGRIISQGQDLPQCAFLLIPKYRTTTGSSIIGRNYDYPAPFDKLSHNVVVTVLRPFNKLPVAIVGIAGEVYCPTCINSKGIFLELNNGTPSGGHDIVQTDTMLARMLQVAQTANNLQDAVKQLDQKSSDYSLIVNVADKQSGVSFEYATANNLGMKWYEFSLLDTSVVTNFWLFCFLSGLASWVQFFKVKIRGNQVSNSFEML